MAMHGHDRKRDLRPHRWEGPPHPNGCRELPTAHVLKYWLLAP